MIYSLVNETNGNVTDADVGRMLLGAGIWSPGFARAWSLTDATGEQAATEAAVCPGGIPFKLTWADPNAPPGALGWHDEQGGAPYVEVPCDIVLQNGGGVLDGGSAGVSIFSVLLHELGELWVDEFVDDWVLMPSGIFLAKEVSDPVQTVPLLVDLGGGTQALGSSYVTPEYFDPQNTTGPFDATGALTAPLSMAPGGYQIHFDPALINDPGGPVVDVFGRSMPTWLRDMKTNRVQSRTARRHHRTWGRLAKRLGRTLTVGQTTWPTS